MSKITKIELQNVKGRNGVVAAGEINLILGSNWSGKTTMLNAVRLGLLGYEPSLGKRPGDSMQLATGDTMKVVLHLENGTSVSRQWRSSGGKCSLRNELPDGFDVPAMMIDIATWFGWTAQERRNFVLSNAATEQDASKLDNELLTRISNVSPEGASHPDCTYELQDILEEVQHYMDDRDAEGVPIAQWFALQIERSKERVRESQLIDKQQTALIETIMQERVENTVAMPPDNSDAIRELTDQLVALRKQQSTDARVAEMAIQKSRAIETVKALEVEGVEQTLAELRKKMELERLRIATIAYTERDCKTAQSQQASVMQTITECRSMIEYLGQQINELAAKSFSDACCPMCERKVTPKMLAKLEAEHESKLKTLRDKQAAFQTTLTKSEKEHAALTDSIKGMEAAVDEYRNINKRIALLQSQITGELLQKESQLIGARAALERLEGIDTSSVGVDVTVNIVNIENQLQALNESQKRRALLLERNGQEAEALEKRDKANRKIKVQKAALEVMETMQSEFVSDVFGPLVTRIRQFTSGLLRFDLEHRDGDLGYVGKRGNWVSHRTFSGAEKAIVYAGLGVALAGGKASVRCVLLDELLVAPENQPKILERFAQLIADGVIDQVFVCDTQAWIGGAAGYTTINCNEKS